MCVSGIKTVLISKSAGMTKKTIEEIIRTYLKNDVPDQVRESFEKWMLEKDSWEEKSDALESLWEKFPAEGIHNVPGKHSAMDIIAEAETAGRKSHKARPAGWRRAQLWISLAASVFFAVVCILQISNRDRQRMCLASSENAKAAFVLPDGSKVWLNKDSRLYYSGKFNRRHRDVRLEGEGFFKVSEDITKPFTVHASDIDVTVLGTEFTVSAYKEGTVSTYLQKGSVRIDGPGLKRGITLGPDQMVCYSGKDNSYTKSPVKASNHTLWISDKLVFDNSSLYDIFEILSHWYHIDIECIDKDFAKNTKLSFTVRQEPVQEILGAIEALIPVTCNMYRDKITITNN